MRQISHIYSPLVDNVGDWVYRMIHPIFTRLQKKALCKPPINLFQFFKGLEVVTHLLDFLCGIDFSFLRSAIQLENQSRLTDFLGQEYPVHVHILSEQSGHQVRGGLMSYVTLNMITVTI